MRINSLLLAVVVLQLHIAWADEDTTSTSTADLAITESVDGSRSTDRGGVILDGRYIAPRYVIITVPGGIELNGHFVPEEGFNERSRRRSGGSNQVRFAERIVNRLEAGGWLVGWEDGEYGMIGDMRIGDILYTLSSDSTQQEKVEELATMDVGWIERNDWRQLVDRCELPDSVVRHHGVGSFVSVVPADPELQAQVQAPRRRFQTSIYLITVFGMGATVFALGTLLSYRPIEKMPWSQVNISKDATQLVSRSVFLLIGLAVLDLVCTTVSAQSASFFELNPLGAAVMAAPWLLALLKIGVTLISGAILLGLRRYHGAQVASWWLALFCTVLAIRWVTFNSMFLA